MALVQCFFYPVNILFFRDPLSRTQNDQRDRLVELFALPTEQPEGLSRGRRCFVSGKTGLISKTGALHDIFSNFIIV